MKRPTTEELGSYVSTPRAASLVKLLGPGAVRDGNVLTNDEFKAIRKLYGFKPEYHSSGEETRNGARDLLQQGADRNAMRHADADGRRIMSWIAKYCQPGQDPLKLIVQAMSRTGFDVDEADLDWSYEDDGLVCPCSSFG